MAVHPGFPAVHTDLSDGALADLRGHRLELGLCGQVEFIVPQQLKEQTSHRHVKIQKDFKNNL